MCIPRSALLYTPKKRASSAPQKKMPEQVVRRRSSFFSPSPSPPPPGEDEFKRYVSDRRHFSMLRQLQVADFITILNCYCGFNSIISSVNYTSSGEPRDAYWAMLFTFLGCFFDVFDGRVARWMNQSSLVGKELDSLADLVSFGVAPATIGYTLGLDTTVDGLLLSFFVLCGLLRLARFNVTAAFLSKGSNKVSHFEGLPIPSSLALVVVMAFTLYSGNVHSALPLGRVFVGTWFEFHPAALIFAGSGCTMISKSLRIPKL